MTKQPFKKTTLESSITEQLDQKIVALSPDITRKLSINRQAVLQRAAKPGLMLILLSHLDWKPVLASAFSIVLLVTVFVQFRQHEESIEADVMELMVAEEQLELFQQLEFYEWLAEEEQQQGTVVDHNTQSALS